MKNEIKRLIQILFAICLFLGGLYIPKIDTQAASQIAYFTKATSITTQGGSETKNYIGNAAQTGNGTYRTYSNTTADNNTYVIFENSVKAANENYDLVVYPFKGTNDASVMLSAGSAQWNKSPAVRSPSSGYAFYKMVITKHGQINNTVSMKILFGCSDLDGGEYVGLPSSFESSHIGSNISETNITSPMVGKQYMGTKESTTNKMAMTTNCIVGTINIPSTGMVVCYGSKDSRSATFAFDEILDYWGDDIIPDPKYEYKIQFNANGGSGSVPSTITKEGVDSSVVMGDISSTIPTRSGYIFKGWSASSSWNSKRIAYSSSYGGETAKDGTSATTTSSSWSFFDYCNYTGGSTSSRTLNLYAQWEKDTTEYTIQFNANGGSGSVPYTISKEGTDTSVVMGDISSTVPTRSGYIFKGWSASSSWNSKRIAYSSSAGGSTASDGTSAAITSSSWSYATYCEKTGGSTSNNTLTLYAMWRTAYTHTLAYNANGGNGEPSNSTVTNDSTTTNLTVSNTVPTRTGYTFTGWNTNASGTGTDYSAGGSVSVGANATVTLYAKWTPNSSTLKVNPNGGTWNGSSSEQSFTQNYNTTKDIPVPTRTGYTFTGWTRTNTYGSMSSLTESATYTFGATNGVIDIITANWQVNNYDVTYIDVVKETGKKLGRSTESKPYGSSVKGIDKGASTADNAYYKNYALVEGTDGYTIATVDTSNNTVVYRYFKWLTTDISGTVNWTDAHNAYGTRPDKVKIVIFQNGIPVSSVVTVFGTKDIEPVILSTAGDINSFTFPDMPAYDSAGYPYTYDVRMYDLDAAADIQNPSSVMSLEYPESKYVTTQNGYNIYNVLGNTEEPDGPPEGFTVSGAIHWVDSGNKLGLRPSTVTIELYQDGKPFMVNGKHYTITVDAINDNTYKFIKLPKYKYVDGQPVPYEYTAVETIVSNYVKDGVIYPLYDIHTDENMGEYEKLHFTNYIKTEGPIIPIVPPDERANTITVITNTGDKVDIVLKMLDFYITESPENVNVQYGPGYNGDEYNLSVSELGEIIKHLPSGKYEIDINESKYELKDIHISDNTDNVYITYEDGKYYLVIDHVPGDSWGTVNIELGKKTEYYQARKSINNYFIAPIAKRIVGGYIELPEDRDVSVVKKLMLHSYFKKAVSEPVSAELPEEATEIDTSVIKNIEDIAEEEDTEEPTSIIEDESEKANGIIEDPQNDSFLETSDVIVGNGN